MRFAWLLLTLCWAGSSAVHMSEGSPNIQAAGTVVHHRTIASSDMPDSPQVEPRLAIAPKNARHLLIGAMLFRRNAGGDSECSPMASFDAGATWRRAALPQRDGVTGGGDPWVAFDQAGTAYLSCLHGVRTESGERTSGVGVYRSDDGGITWTGPAMLPGRAYDRPVLVVGASEKAGQTTLHVVASQGTRHDFGSANPISISTSIDGGRTFAQPVQVLFNNLNNNVRSAVALPDGTLLAVFSDVGSLDGRRLEQFRVWSIRSTDGGRSFGPALFVNENAGGDQVDVTGDPTGRLFAVWDVVRGPREGRGVFFAQSEDAGKGWSAATRIAELAEGERQQHVPTVAARPDGTIAAFWVDYRSDSRGDCSEVYIRGSRDLGKTWTDARRLSTKASCPRSPSNTVTRTDGKPNAVDRRWMEGGDYHGLVVGEQGRFHAAWSDSSTGVFQIHFATIEVTEPARLSPDTTSAVR
jgi:hypothetical protein